MDRRLAIIRYKLAARALRRLNGYNSGPSGHRDAYATMEAARKAMLTACGYDRAYSYMGEFCNLHERDFPSYIRAALHPCDWDVRHNNGDGRVYRFSGWQSPVTRAELLELASRDRRRALELQRTLERDPVDRFLAGWAVIYQGFGDTWYHAKWTRGGSDGVPFLAVYECSGFFARTLRMRPVMGEAEARAFFAGLPEPVFDELPLTAREAAYLLP